MKKQYFSDSDHSILQRLKTATASRHRQVEQRFKILDPQLSLDQYINWLARLYGYYEPFERMIEPWSVEIAIGWTDRRKTPLLVKDLSLLGLTNEEIASLPACHSLPVLTNIGSLFGALYVFEGATLGGRFIANHLSNILKLDAENGAGSFLPYGVDPKPHWLAFQSRLCEVAASDFNENQIILSAKETFDSFDAWLAEF